MSPELLMAATRGPQVEDMQSVAARGLKLGNIMQDRQLGQLQMQQERMKIAEAQRAQAESEKVRQAWISSGGDEQKYAAALSGISPGAAQQYQTWKAKNAEDLAKADEVKLKNDAARNDALRGGIMAFEQQPDEFKADSKNWMDFIYGHAKKGHISKDELLTLPTKYPGSDWMTLHANGAALGSQLAKEEIDRRTAAAHEKTAQTGEKRLAAEMPGIEAEGFVKQLTAAAQQLAGVSTQADYDAWRNALPTEKLKNFVPAMFSPAGKEAVMMTAIGPQETMRLKQQAARDTETARHNAVDEKLGMGRLNVSGADLELRNREFQQKYGDALDSMSPNNLAIARKLAAGDYDPSQMGRMPGKEQIIAGAIALNPNWTPQTYATKKSFTDPEKTQAKNLATISRIVGHIGRFEQNSAEADWSPMYSMGMNLTGTQNKLNEDAHAVAGELEKLVSGGVGSQSQTEAWMKSLRSPSAEARKKAIDEISQLIGSQYEGMNQQYKAGTGQDLPVEKYLSPVGQKWLRDKKINVTGDVESGGRKSPAPGALEDGWRFKGGNPADQKNWEKVN